MSPLLPRSGRLPRCNNSSAMRGDPEAHGATLAPPVVLPRGVLRGHRCQPRNDSLALSHCIKSFPFCRSFLNARASLPYNAERSRCQPSLPGSDLASPGDEGMPARGEPNVEESRGKTAAKRRSTADRFRITDQGLRAALFFTRLYNRLQHRCRASRSRRDRYPVAPRFRQCPNPTRRGHQSSRACPMKT
jgi:hypothetical protein